MVVLDSTIANIALPYIQHDLDISQANLQWVVTGYALAFGGLLLLGGRLGDLYGRRRVFMIGVTIFAIASLLGGLAQNELMLLGSRGLQGLGAALASPAALALITTTFPAGPQRNRAFSVYAAMSGVGAAVGLLLGGWLTGLHPEIFGISVDGWRLTFLINVPIGLAAAYFATALARRVRVAPRRARPARRRHRHPRPARPRLRPLPRRQPGYGWGDTWTIASLIAGVAAARPVRRDRAPRRAPAAAVPDPHEPHPRDRFVTMMIVPAAMFAMFFFLSLVHPERDGLQPDQGRPRVPAVLLRHGVRRDVSARS